MPALFHSDGRPLTDTAGNQLRTGQTITDQFLGDGIVRGTIPLDKGEGLNVLIDWLGPKDTSKPKSRGAEHLTVKYALITNSTPRLFAKFNYRISWADNSKVPSKLGVESYAYGADARYNSWVILKPL